MSKSIILLSALLLGIEENSDDFFSYGKLSLQLMNDIGQYNIYYRDHKAELFLPLLDHETAFRTMLTIQEDGRFSILGNDASYRYSNDFQNMIPTQIWESHSIEVRQRFGFVSEQVIQIVVSLKNKTQLERSVGLRYIFDLKLDEFEGANILLYNSQPINQEYEIINFNKNPILISESGDSNFPGLVFIFAAKNVSVPDRIVIANWDRLIRSPWYYTVSEFRALSASAVRSKDSAIAYYFQSAPIQPAGTRNISILLGITSALDQIDWNDANALQGIPEISAFATEQDGNIRQRQYLSEDQARIRVVDPDLYKSYIRKVSDRLEEVEQLSNTIERYISNENAITEEEMLEIETRIEALQKELSE